MSPYYFFGVIASFIIGVFLGDIIPWGYPLALLFVIVAVAYSFVGGVSPYRRYRLLIPLVLIVAAGGVMRMSTSSYLADTHILDPFMGERIELRGIVITEPDMREEYTNIVLEAHELSQRSTRYQFDTPVRVLVRTPMYPVFRYGDEVTTSGEITLPKNIPQTKGRKMFNYRAFLAKDGIYYQMFFPSVMLLTHGRGNIVYEKLFALKESFVSTVAQRIPEPEASLGNGILLGAKQSLGSDLLRQFRETGVAHIVVLSGYNIAIIAGMVAYATRFLPFAARIAISALAVVLFSMMVGGGATVVRAAIMILVVVGARAVGREASALRALALAGGIMVAQNPLILLHDISFQLSFTATLALVVFAPVIERYFLFIRRTLVREVVVATIAAQIFVLPLILYYMGNISLVGVITNLFIVPIVPLVMLSVFVVVLIGWVPLIGSIFSFFALALLTYVLSAVSFFSQIPFASLSGISFPLWALIISYLLFSILIIKSFFGRST